MHKIYINFLLLVSLPYSFSVGEYTFFSNLDIPSWCYSVATCNEATWTGKCTSKFHQSPVDLPIDFNSVIHSHHETIKKFPKNDLIFDGYTIYFRGHALQIKPAQPAFRFSRLLHSDIYVNYTLYALDIHWGKSDTAGSEHTLDGNYFAGEVHLAFYNEDQFTPFENDDPPETILEKAGDLGILIIGVFLDVAPAEDVNATNSFWMHKLTDQVAFLQNDSPLETKDKLNLTDLFDGVLGYRYPGSFTTPSCHPVEWIMMRQPVQVPVEHMEMIRRLQVDGLAVDGNNRR